jgi:hypothetical protein
MKNSKITFCICTAKNELPYIKLLFKSLDINLNNKDHDFIVFVDGDNQNTFEWLKTQKNIFKNLTIIKNPLPMPLGGQRNINIMFEMAKTDIVSYLQSDMVICKDYDLEILKYLDENTLISSTRIEPPLHPPSPEKITRNLGLSPDQFIFEDLLEVYNKEKQDKLTDYWFAPFTLYKKNWMDIGGYDTLFRRSREDSDILYRFCIKGLKIKQYWGAMVYHFSCVSSRGIDWWKEENNNNTNLIKFADSIEMQRFFRKWGTFRHSTDPISGNDYKYNISIKIKNSKNKEKLILDIHHMFNKISIDSRDCMAKLIYEYDNFHTIANSLLKIENSTWNKYKKLYNIWEGNNIFTSDSIDDDILVECDLEKIEQSDLINLNNLSQIIHENGNDIGTFELGNIIVNVNKIKNRLNENLKVNNPTFDIDLIYA